MIDWSNSRSSRSCTISRWSKSQKAAPETLAEGSGGILLIDEGGIVQLVFLERVRERDW